MMRHTCLPCLMLRWMYRLDVRVFCIIIHRHEWRTMIMILIDILHFIVTNMITINQNRNHPPEPRTWKLMVGSWNVGVSAYFQGRISLAVRGAKMTRPGRRCTRTCPWAETGGSENLSWPVIQLDRKKWDRKNAQKTIKKIQVRMPCQKLTLNLPAPVFQVLIHQPQGGATPCKTSCQADGFVPHPWKSTTTESYISTSTASNIVGKLRFWMILCILSETRTVSLHLKIDGF